MKLGFVKELKTPGEFQTVNDKVKIILSVKNGHMHVKVSGAVRLSVLTSVKSDLTKLEMLTLASYVYRQLDHYPHLSDARKAIDTNYAGVFGSLWLGGF